MNTHTEHNVKTVCVVIYDNAARDALLAMVMLDHNPLTAARLATDYNLRTLHEYARAVYHTLRGRRRLATRDATGTTVILEARD